MQECDTTVLAPTCTITKCDEPAGLRLMNASWTIEHRASSNLYMSPWLSASLCFGKNILTGPYCSMLYLPCSLSVVRTLDGCMSHLPCIRIFQCIMRSHQTDSYYISPFVGHLAPPRILPPPSSTTIIHHSPLRDCTVLL